MVFNCGVFSLFNWTLGTEIYDCICCFSDYLELNRFKFLSPKCWFFVSVSVRKESNQKTTLHTTRCRSKVCWGRKKNHENGKTDFRIKFRWIGRRWKTANFFVAALALRWARRKSFFFLKNECELHQQKQPASQPLWLCLWLCWESFEKFIVSLRLPYTLRVRSTPYRLPRHFFWHVIDNGAGTFPFGAFFSLTLSWTEKKSVSLSIQFKCSSSIFLIRISNNKKKTQKWKSPKSTKAGGRETKKTHNVEKVS